MSTRHRKKRNAALMYEFLVRTISRALLENDSRKQVLALKILKKYFKPGTELHREFRLANAMYKSTVSSSAVAASIMQEAKTAVRAVDATKLEREKSLLIREVNHGFNDVAFYDQSVKDYKILATIQTLFDEWRTPSDIATLAEYEDKVNQWLIADKTINESSEDDTNDPGIIRLAAKVMTRKLNEKYADSLSDEQKSLVRAYALNESTNDGSTVVKYLTEVRSKLLSQLRDYEFVTPNGSQKLNEVKEMLLGETLEKVDDDVITRFMLYSKLCAELSEGAKSDVS